MNIRILTQIDWENWKNFRLAALKEAPNSFGSSYEEEFNLSDLNFQETLTKSDIFGVFVDNHLVSCAGFYSLPLLRMKHRGVIWGMYTLPEYRGQSFASTLMKTVINHAKSRVSQIHLTCVTSNAVGLKFYQKHGFKIYGTEPKALKVNDTYFDEHLMILDLENNMKKLDTYLDLCTQVYDISKPNAPEDAYAFYRDYVVRAKGPVLEPMCGTGRFLLPLLGEGFNVQGFDASESMLNQLRNKASLKNLIPNVWKGFVEDLKKDESFNLIFIPSGSICLITAPATLKLVFKTFFDHLNKGGILLFEIDTMNAVPPLDIWRGSVWNMPEGDKIILSQCATLSDQICHSVCKYELVHDNSIVSTEIEEYEIKIFNQNELMEMLTQMGFAKVRTMKAFDRSMAPSDMDESIVVECTK